MRVLIISDIHANLTALETVLDAAGNVDAVWCLGDVIGYGPNPNECVELLQEQPKLICLMGNHDAAAVGEMSTATFNSEARTVVEWTQGVLTKENITFLRRRPQTSELDEVTLAHGSPRQPIFEYVLDVKSAEENFEYFGNDYCFIGHSHIPLMFHQSVENDHVKFSFPQANTVVELQPRTIINPGSVGQPRDRDPRASYAVYDTEAHTWEYRRVDYEFSKTQELMRKAGLPERHISRLSGGW